MNTRLVTGALASLAGAMLAFACGAPPPPSSPAADAPSASDRDVAWLLDVAGRRADADGRRDRALHAYTAALAVYRRRGLSRLARAVEERLAALTAAG